VLDFASGGLVGEDEIAAPDGIIGGAALCEPCYIRKGCSSLQSKEDCIAMGMQWDATKGLCLSQDRHDAGGGLVVGYPLQPLWWIGIEQGSKNQYEGWFCNSIAGDAGQSLADPCLAAHNSGDSKRIDEECDTCNITPKCGMEDGKIRPDRIAIYGEWAGKPELCPDDPTKFFGGDNRQCVEYREIEGVWACAFDGNGFPGLPHCNCDSSPGCAK